MNILEQILAFVLTYGPQIVQQIAATGPAIRQLMQDLLDSGALADDDYAKLQALCAQYDADFEAMAAKWEGESGAEAENPSAENPPPKEEVQQ